MYNFDDMNRLELVSLKVEYILDICKDGIVAALHDKKILRPAVLMHLTSVAEQFAKIKDENLLNNFDKADVRGAIDTRNFIPQIVIQIVKSSSFDISVTARNEAVQEADSMDCFVPRNDKIIFGK
ncbi:MAG: hypothetical protein HY307_02395 [Arcobacter sp.]|nr:hypothetical protein [Arcobacter sp.]